jgi:hypothetical protein
MTRSFSWSRTVLAATAGLVLGGVALAAGGDPGRAPDPPALAASRQWVFSIRYKNKRPTVERVTSAETSKPVRTARAMGRFAIELYVGPELIDRVRFNVPLTADPPDPRHRRPFARPSFDDVSTRVRVVMADAPRATWAILLDRATGDEQRFWWPPEQDGTLRPRPLPRGDADAGPPSDAAATSDGP